MAGQYYNSINEYCCAVTDFDPAIAANGATVTHTFTLDVGTNGAAAFSQADVRVTDFAGNTATATATGTYPSMTVDITWPAVAGNYTVYIDSTFSDGSPVCTVQLEGEVVVS